MLYFLLAAHPGRTLIFANAVSTARRVAALLKILRMPSAALHAGEPPCCFRTSLPSLAAGGRCMRFRREKHISWKVYCMLAATFGLTARGRRASRSQAGRAVHMSVRFQALTWLSKVRRIVAGIWIWLRRLPAHGLVQACSSARGSRRWSDSARTATPSSSPAMLPHVASISRCERCPGPARPRVLSRTSQPDPLHSNAIDSFVPIRPSSLSHECSSAEPLCKLPLVLCTFPSSKSQHALLNDSTHLGTCSSMPCHSPTNGELRDSDVFRVSALWQSQVRRCSL